jgi:glycosyltransferase involved in cell wall biosynthesis
MKVAIVYDRVNKWGGAERVLLALNELFPNAPLFTSVYSKNRAKWAEVFPRVIPSFLQKLPLSKTRHEFLAPFMPLAFESHDLSSYDLVISVTSEAAKGVLTGKNQKHICYCLTPTRYLWSGEAEYFKNTSFKQITAPLRNALKRWDKTAAKRPDTMIAISTEVQDRIKKYYERETEIVFPPVDINKFKIQNPKRETKRNAISIGSRLRGNDNGYFLVVSRLVPYKKVDLVVETFNDLGIPLVIVGTGTEEKKLRRKAKTNIFFTGSVTDEELAMYYKNATGLVFPQEEDFGIVSLEAQAMGVPVLAFTKGGSRDTVIQGKTGIFFEEQTKDSLKHAIDMFSTIRFNKKTLRSNAEKFSQKKFQKNFLKKI